MYISLMLVFAHALVVTSLPQIPNLQDRGTVYPSDETSRWLLSRDSALQSTSGPPWHLSNFTCDNVTTADKELTWGPSNGNDGLKEFLDFYNNNKLLCPSCLGLTKDKCSVKGNGCDKGLRDNAPAWDIALGHYADLQFDVDCGINGKSCGPFPCEDLRNSSTVYVIYQSLVNLSNLVVGIANALQDARQTVGDQANRFTKALAPLPDYKDDRIFFAAVTSILGGAIGAVPGVGGIAGGLFNVFNAVGSAAFTNSQKTVPPDGLGELGLIADSMQDSLRDMSSQLFSSGTYKWDGGSTNLADMMKDGKLITLDTDPTKSFYRDVSTKFKQALYQQLGVFVWSFWESDDCVHHPFITFAGKPCDQLDYNDPKSVPITGIGLDKLDVNITVDGKCYWLLDACPMTSLVANVGSQDWEASCQLVRPLPGGTNHDMKSNDFSGLGIEHFIVPSVKGWQANKNVNGFPIAGFSPNDTGLDPLRPGGANISVCDYMTVNSTKGLPGIGCPLINQRLHVNNARECTLQAPNSVPDPPGEFQPGSCKIHVQQFQRNEQVDVNPLGDYQLYIVVTDDSNRPIGSAAKEDVPGVVNVWDTSLPYDLLVRPGPKDNDGFEFWYSDQYWTSDDKSPQHNCNVGKYDQGNRQLDCAFDCPMPVKGQPAPPSATIGHLLPLGSPVESGVPVTEYLNTFRPAPTQAPVSDPGARYPGGKCQIHLIQYDKGTLGWNDDYMIEAYLNHGAQLKTPPFPFAQTENGQVPIKPDTPHPIYGLRTAMNVTCPGKRDDPVTFNFDDGKSIVTWKSDDKSKDHQCYSTGFGQGHRDIYCDFVCP